MTHTARIRRRRRVLILVGIALLLLLLAAVVSQRKSGTASLTLSFAGYTNLPNNSTRFALFSLRNQSPLPVRWRGYWVEVDGAQHNQAPVVNSALPFFSVPVLSKGGELTVAIGEPEDGAQWRFVVLWSRYDLKARALDFAMKHRLPTGIGRWSVLDAQQILSPKNFVTNRSPWLAK